MSTSTENRKDGSQRPAIAHRRGRNAVHRSFQELFRQVENFWIASGKPPVPETDVPDMARRIVSALEAAVGDELMARARRNLQAAFAEQSAGAGQDEWMSPNEAARYLRMSRTTLLKMMNAGELNFRNYKVGRHLRISRNDVETHWDALMAAQDPVKAELVRHGEEIGLYSDPEQ